MAAQIVERAPRPRIQSLSDLIFGLALSISALTLIGEQPTSTQKLVFSLGVYAFSFLILIQIWRFYSSLSSVLSPDSSGIVELNIVLLFFVSIEPYLFNELFTLKGLMFQYITGAYSIDLASMLLVLTLFDHFLASDKKQSISKSLRNQYRMERNLNILISAIFAISVLPYFGQDIVIATHFGEIGFDLAFRSLLWVVGLALMWMWRFSKIIRSRTPSRPVKLNYTKAVIIW